MRWDERGFKILQWRCENERRYESGGWMGGLSDASERDRSIDRSACLLSFLPFFFFFFFFFWNSRRRLRSLLCTAMHVNVMHVCVHNTYVYVCMYVCVWFNDWCTYKVCAYMGMGMGMGMGNAVQCSAVAHTEIAKQRNQSIQIIKTKEKNK